MIHKRFLAITIAVALAASIFSSCSQGETAAKAKKVEKPTSISLMVDGTFLPKENGQDILVEGYKALTGIELVVNQPAHNEYYQKLNLAFSTGDVPDVVLLGSYAYASYGANGSLYDLTELYEKSSLKDRVKDPAIIEALKINGRLYGIPYERGNGTVTYVRGDWLEKLGLQPPTNYDEFINMLRLFKNKNPDGLKPDKVIPLTAAGLVNSEYPLDIYLREFYQDASPDFIKKDGKWIDGMSDPAMVAALKRMRDAYAEGLIDKEIITNKTSTCRDKFYSGVVGVFNYWAGTWNRNLALNIEKNNPQAKVTPIPAIKETKYIERPATVIAITKNCKNPEAVFKYFFEFLLDGDKGQTFATFGVEGKTYEIKDGMIQFLPSVQDPAKPFVKAWFSPELPVFDWNPAWKPTDERITNSLAIFQKDAVSYKVFPSSDTISQLLPELNTIKANYVTKIVYGTLSIEEGLAQYQKDAQKYVEAILAELAKVAP
ncbi:extracellular solute-binding protein [Treponema sp. J25]|uniref:extracellular solute-binding protein n=1 Tax=Treponema sp. J25 TaxID=2094121 RepID=UPI00104E326D|nr:extracellular solute-binding protein [Treponema sp. J25]TCW60360.1 ABC transporter substrate-binding protein [Treponema sp. J25]